MYNAITNFKSRHDKRIVGLDILRTIAILLVVYSHGIYLFPSEFREAYFKYFISIDGVSVFFVLSGFLIGNILLRIISQTDFSSKDLFDFWVRRWFRTVPNYVLVLTFVLLMTYIRTGGFDTFSLSYLFFAQNLIVEHPPFFPEAWSLCIEEWFYLLFPLICFILHKMLNDKKSSVLYSALIFLIFPLLIRIIKFEAGIGVDAFEEQFRKITLLRIDSIMYGIVAAYIYENYKDLWIKFRYPLLGLGIILVVALKYEFYHIFQIYHPIIFNIESVIVLLFIPFFSELKTTKSTVLDVFFIFISIISYSMYLLNLTPVQENIMFFVNLGKWFDHSGQMYWVNTIFYWFLTIALSVVVYKVYEKPMTKLRDELNFK